MTIGSATNPYVVPVSQAISSQQSAKAGGVQPKAPADGDGDHDGDSAGADKSGLDVTA